MGIHFIYTACIKYALYTDYTVRIIYRLAVHVCKLYRLPVLHKHALQTDERTKDTNQKTNCNTHTMTHSLYITKSERIPFQSRS